ncbi:tRNA-specific adenosine deaminase [Aspergillus saccharolyticus JOP 1030-1]|uniref:A to I editase domain-containing protein n=1 Tax=Aspergillus saccharolyticus JOP 1030-1 TaxID=1450539 RepID=A0A318Z7B3_9EURO|nr:hypothetical protein BP01DRAFT_393575 [Aspergillus saccharolyticus JOP 1030-1]PYH43225.1 hypothetical protein BP01DRAFT_393575 [Aspergillus saccharolyticus JOP 1030-1]
MKDELPSRIARLVHTHFDALPARSKPIIRDDGTREWIPMAGMVVVRGENTPDEELTCVAVTSGAKCLAASQLPACKGLVLHDWHAEVLALRAFNHWVLSEVKGLLAERHTGTSSSRFIRRRDAKQQQQQPDPPFELHPDLKVYMCCTCAPCGDASMELTMAAQEDPTPWVQSSCPSTERGSGSAPHLESDAPTPSHATTTTTTSDSATATLLDGRAHFSKLGIVRRKPARADADSTKSKSCSDKLALRQVTSLLSPSTALLVAVTPAAYLAGVVLPETEISEVGCQRAFGREGRMRGLVGGDLAPLLSADENTRGGLGSNKDKAEEDSSGYRFHPFKVLSIPSPLADSLWQYGKPRDAPVASAMTKYKPGTISAVWVAAPSVAADQVVFGPASGAKQLPKLAGSRTGLYESLIGGVKQGSKASAPVVRGASALSRARMWGSLREIVCGGSHSVGEGAAGAGNTVLHGVSATDINRLRQIVGTASYADFKKAITTTTPPGQARERARQQAKTVLVPWVPNPGDEDWGLDVLVDTNPKKRKR